MGFKARNSSTSDKEIYLLDDCDGEVHVMIEDYYIVTIEKDGKLRLHGAVDSATTGLQTNDENEAPIVVDPNDDTFESLRAELAGWKAEPRPRKAK